MPFNPRSLQKVTARIMDEQSFKVPQVDLQQYYQITPKKHPVPSFELLCSHGPYAYSEQQYADAISDMFKNRFKLVAGTVNHLGSVHKDHLVSMIVHANTPSVPYEEQSVKGMILISANVFQDPDDNIWRVSGEGEAKRLVQVSDDDVEAILAARQSKRVVTASQHENHIVNYQNGDFVLYFCPSDLEVKAGLIYTTDRGIRVFDRQQEKPVTLYSPRQVVEAVSGYGESEETTLDIPAHWVEATLTGEMGNRMLEYMRRLFANTTFFDRLEDFVRKRRAMGDEGMHQTLSPQLPD